MNKYKIYYFDYSIQQEQTEVVKAKTAEDAVFIWKTNNDTTTSMKHFTGVQALEEGAS